MVVVVVVGTAIASWDVFFFFLFSPEASQAPCRGRGELKLTGRLVVVTQH